MADFYIHKVLALPATLDANAIYLVTDTDANFLEMYVSNAAGTAQRRIPTKTDVESWIATAIANAGISSSTVTANIAARDALTPSVGDQSLVIDATADATVDAGAATYVWDGTAWVKISEAESMDVVVAWADITGGPTATPAQIDATVAASHSHANIAVLNKLSEDGDGDLNYDGAFVRTGWDSTDW